MHVPMSIVAPVESWTVRRFLSNIAVQSALHSFPMLIRLFLKPGIMCPNCDALVGRAGIASCAVAIKVCCSPVAVRIVVWGVNGFVLMSRVVSAK